MTITPRNTSPNADRRPPDPLPIGYLSAAREPLSQPGDSNYPSAFTKAESPQNKSSISAKPGREFDFQAVITESGASLQALTDSRPTLTVFLRHWGCSFCRETISDLSKLYATLEARGVGLVFVHMGTPERARPYFDYYNFSSVERISDPEQHLYRDPVFALGSKAIWKHLFDLAAAKSVLGGIILRHGISFIHREDADQMPGVFLLYRSKIVRSYKYKSIADKPDFLKMIRDVGQISE